MLSAFSPGQEFPTASQKSFQNTGFQNTLSGVYNPVVFSASGANLTEAHLFCLLACDRDSCCDGFILAQVQGGNVTWRARPLYHDPWSDKGQGLHWVTETGIYGMGMAVGSCRHEVTPFTKKVIFAYTKSGTSRDPFNVSHMCKPLHVVIVVILMFSLLLSSGEALGVPFYKLRN